MNLRRHARDTAWEMSRAVCHVFAPLLRDEELVEAHREVFAIIEPGLYALLVRYERARVRAALGAQPKPDRPPAATQEPASDGNPPKGEGAK
jgi:hypothetical protein